ncbi:hypothetical protein AYO38_03755 [bacterium SCGC AG-212-C10]|nr:hypothetical protein AYO38_03755 [bacterium SCGC AG-212-C10]
MPSATAPEPTRLDPTRSVFDMYRESSERLFDFVPSLEMFAPDDESREIARLMHESMRARAGVVREWLMSPLWLSGLASPSDLSDRFSALIEKDRQLGEAWTEYFRVQGQRQNGLAREAVDVAGQSLRRVQEANESAADTSLENIRKASLASHTANNAATEVAEQAVTGTTSAGVATVSAATETLELMREAAEETAKTGLIASGLNIKGNTNREGEKVFHVPGQSSYDRLQTDTLFPSQSAAIEAGYRISRSTGGPQIKGNIGRDGSRVYHKPGQANYDRVEPEALFATEEEAVDEGFRPAQR